MPLINVKVIEGVFKDSQKKEMVARLTDAMVSIEGENMRPVTWVVVEEVKSGDWGIGGKALTTEAVRALAAEEASHKFRPLQSGSPQRQTARPPFLFLRGGSSSPVSEHPRSSVTPP